MPAEPTPKTLTADPGQPKGHFSIDVKFPVYSIAFTDDSHAILAGGGGASRSGIKNRLSLYKIAPTTKSLHLVNEHELSKDEDAPMSIAVNSKTHQIIAGINSSAEQLKQGVNNNVRLFSYDPEHIEDGEGITFVKAKGTLTSRDEDHYQKVTAFSRSTPTLVSIGSTNSQLSVVTFPELDEVFPSIEFDKGEEVFDTDFNDSGELVLGASSSKLCVWSTKPGKGFKDAEDGEVEGQGEAQLLQVIERPILKKTLACTFRAAKFGRGPTADFVYTVVNASPAVRSRKPKAGEKKSLVSKWDTKTWKLLATRTVSQRPVTAFDISDDGELLAYGSSDLSVGVLDAKTLRPILTILKAHDFPVTSLKFNPSGTLLISGSADNSVRVITIPVDARKPSRTFVVYNILLTLVVLILAVLVQRTLTGKNLATGQKHILY